MLLRRRFVLALLCAFLARIGSAQVFGSVSVNVRDPQNLAVANSEVTIKAKGSTWSETTRTNPQGDAIFVAVPFGGTSCRCNPRGSSLPNDKSKCFPPEPARDRSPGPLQVHVL